MEFIGQVPGSSDTVQSDSIDIPNQDQILAPMIPREPLHANNANELAIFQTCSGKETTCITAGMSTSAESMIHEESPDKPHHIQDGISVPHSSAISVAPGALDLLEHLAALVVMTNQFTDKMPSLGSSSPGADDGTTDSRDRLGRLCIAPNSNDVDLSTLNTLIHLHRQQHFLSNSNISQLAAIISRLLLAQATLLDAVSEFDRVIEHLTLAAQISQGDRSTWINTMQRLSIAYRRRFETHGSAGDIDSAIECQQQAIAYAGDKHESYVILIGELGMLLNLRYEVSGDVGDIQEAIKNGTLALVHTPEASDNRISLLDSLGNSHGYRFFRLGELEDISKLTPEGHPNLPTRLSNLGISYSSRFEGLGELEDIVKAIDIQTRAVKLAPEEHPAIPGGDMSV
ncbi:hypothetical protein BDV93DRAFT_595934 [Ceratobasidium sp. AG-I]|nr:hypothetical protein BDV93DRAFT_595934 [Ceratobasidium sp. AG-I]